MSGKSAAQQLGEAHCSFGSDCMCANFHGRPDHSCRHHWRFSRVESLESPRPAAPSVIASPWLASNGQW